MSEELAAITVRGLGKRYRLGGPSATHAASTLPWWRRLRPGSGSGGGGAHDFWALNDVSFDLPRGERLGIIGRNGAGKSTLLKVISRLIYPTTGEVRIRGRVTALLEVGTGMNDNLTGRENIFVNAALHGMTHADVKRRFDEIVDFSGLGEFIDEPVKAYSSGMRSRLGFAVAAHLDPEILILDEVLAVGDMAFVQKCLLKVQGLTARGRTVIFVSHSLSDIVRFCDRGLWLEKGRIVMAGDVRQVADEYSKSMLGLTAEAVPEAAAAAPTTAAMTETPGVPDPERRAADIVSFRLLDDAGRPKTAFVRQEPIRIELRYRAQRNDLPLIASIHIHMEGLHVLSTHPPATMMPEIGGIYDAIVEVPPRLLNKGVYHFSAAVVTPVRPILRHAKLERAVSCAVFDLVGDKDIFSGDYRGVVRPDLAWRVERHVG